MLLTSAFMDDRTHAELLDRAKVSPARMRNVLGNFASGIVVITAIGPDGPVGFTCQSFASLSLDPPLITFCPARTSTTWPKIRDRGRFWVNVLADHHEEISNRFARSGGDKFAGIRWGVTKPGAPVLSEVCAWVECTLADEFDGGDHTIVVGRVRDLSADAARRPLLFHRGRYGMAESVEASS